MLKDVGVVHENNQNSAVECKNIVWTGLKILTA